MTLKKKTLFTSHPSNDREKKNLLFLNLIKSHKSTSRTELSKLTDINIVTVSNYVTSYLKKGLVVERGYDVSSGGRRPELVELNREWGYVAGIHIGKDCARGVLADLNMQILSSESIQGSRTKNLKSLVNEISKKLLESSKIDKTRVKKIGISASKDSGDIIEDVINQKDAVEEEIKIPVLIGDSALCAASGEKDLNPDAIGAGSILYVYRDLGQGIFIKDDEFYDARDKESKYAYLRAWNQGMGIANEAKGIIKQGVGSNMADIAKGSAENITLDTVIKAAREKDEIAVDLLRTAGMNLAVRIAYLINLLEPKTVIIGGGIEKAGELFLKPLVSGVKKFILQKIRDSIKLAPAVLGEEACVKGVASLAIRETFIEA